jgi:tetraacyldisaccharide 4'-kinase
VKSVRAPSFWWRKPGLAATGLAPVAAIYGRIAGKRLAGVGRRVGIPVVCIGNLTLGGSGKTPAALAVARILIADGERPWFLSRGYGGRQRGPLVVDPNKHRAEDVGDEPLLLARVAPTVVGHDRPAGALLARNLGASSIVMDDGFQNPSLDKQLSIITIDGRHGIGNARVFPSGPLRAPLHQQLVRAQVLIVVGDIALAASTIAIAEGHGLAAFRAQLKPDPEAVKLLSQAPALAFAGIGHPDKFFKTLLEAGIRLGLTRGFADHHGYTPAQANRLLAEAERHGWNLVTTEKDWVRLRGDPRLGALAQRARALPVRLVLDREQDFAAVLRSALSAHRGAPACARA